MVIIKINLGKAIVLVGARQVGKTTLLKEILKEKEYLFFDADDPTIRSLLSNPNTEQIRTIIGDSKCIFIDEAQRIPGIGLTLKIITDQFRDVQLFVSGSSSFDFGNELNEPLTGRKWEYELSQIVGINKVTVQKYIEVLERGYIVFRLSSFSRNLRNEIKQNRKVYFYDNGIRNMIIGNFNQLDLRPDNGALWENFLVSERRKQNIYKDTFSKMYFWRTKQQQEIDFVEEVNGNISGFEFKWAHKKTKFPQIFMDTYNATGIVIDRANFRDFVNIEKRS